MSTGEKLGAGFSAVPVGNTVVMQQPDQVAFPLTRDKFEMLQQGFVSEERQSRDLALGIFIGALVGCVGFLATADWSKKETFFWLAVLAAILLASVFCWVFFAFKARRAKLSKGYVRIVREIESHFNPPQQ